MKVQALQEVWKMSDEKVSSEEILERIETYISDAQRLAVMMKGKALEDNNTIKFMSYQGTIDVTIDVQSILRGDVIPTIEEIIAKNKESEELDQSYLR